MRVENVRFMDETLLLYNFGPNVDTIYIYIINKYINIYIYIYKIKVYSIKIIEYA